MRAWTTIFLLAAWQIPALSVAGESIDIKQSASFSPAEYAVKTAVSLALVISLIFLIAWIYKKMNRARGIFSSDLKIISSVSIGSKEKLIVVEVGDEQILIGATPSKITKIFHLKEKIQSQTNTSSNFKNLFNGVVNGIKKNA